MDGDELLQSITKNVFMTSNSKHWQTKFLVFSIELINFHFHIEMSELLKNSARGKKLELCSWTAESLVLFA